MRDRAIGALVAGLVAILLWSMLAAVTVQARGVPPLELMSISFTVAFALGLLLRLRLLKRGHRERSRPDLGALLTAFSGLFFYHALYFYALAHAPADQASLINYLWPLLIVLFSALLADGAGMRLRHVIGAAFGLCGTVLVVMRHPSLHSAALVGYAAALACAVVWAAYSVFNRRFAGVSSLVILDVCGGVALAAALAHLAIEPRTVVPDARQLCALLILGLGPTGFAFVAWDYATKYGPLPVLGALSYLAPLLSTALLVAVGAAPGGVTLFAAAILVLGGAAIAAGLTGRIRRV
ncbi:MAG: DMT family transporter [Rhodospirillales bacterium]|nr:DMT family transporter [Rhodospirillales bacterium]